MVHLSDLVSTPLWNALSDGLVIVNPHGFIEAANDRITELSGWTTDDLVGSPLGMLVPPEREQAHGALVAGYFDAPRARSMSAGGRLDMRCADGSLIPVLISLAPLEVADETMTVASVRDDLARRTVERRLADATRDRIIVEARENIARDLHDNVIAELFATGVSLEAVSGSIPEGIGRERVHSTIDTLDRVISSLRSAITGYRRPLIRSLQHRLVDLVADVTPALESNPILSLDPGIDDRVDPDVADNIVAVVGEALTNVVRHAVATTVTVAVAIDDERDQPIISVHVVDDGIGIGPNRKTAGGVSNMYRRARDLSGECDVVARSDGGTQVRWTVPLPKPE